MNDSNPVRSVVFLFLMVVFASCQPGSKYQDDSEQDEVVQTETGQIQDVNVASLKSMLDRNSDIILLDVRRPDEIEMGTIPGNKVYAVYGSEDFEEALEQLDKSKSYYVYCGAGVRSSKTLDIMKTMGFDSVVNIEGGFGAWMKNGYEVEK